MAAILVGATRELCRRSLLDFVRRAWPLVEPTTALVEGIYLVPLCLALEAVARGEIRRLIVEMPPRHGKSTIVSVLWPTWVWSWRPSWRALFSTYAKDLTMRDAGRARWIIDTSWYCDAFRGPDGWGLTRDQNVKSRYTTTEMGERFSTSIEASTTGYGGDVLVIDDAINVLDAYSKPGRDQAALWFDQAATSRLNDPKRGAIVIVGHRVHEDDLTGHVLAKPGAAGEWQVLRLPTEYEPDNPCVIYRDEDVPANGAPAHRARIELWRDPRTKAGELLCPERFGPAEVTAAKSALGEDGYAAQHQQRPTPAGGGMFKRAWWRWWKPDGKAPDQVAARPRGCFEGPARPLPDAWDSITVSVDANFKSKAGADPVSIGVIGKKGADRFLLHRVSGPLGFTRTKEALRAVRQLYPKTRKWIIELAANGDAIVEDLIHEFPGMVGVPPRGGKEARAWVIQPQVQAGQCYLPDGAPWAGDFIAQFDSFPLGSHDDDVDMWSQALIDLAEPETTAALWSKAKLNR